MKNSKWLSAALAGAVLVAGGAGSVLATSSSVSAASVKAAVTTGTGNWSVDGASSTFSTINSNGYKLYALSEVAGALGAKLVAGANGYELNDSKGLHTVHIQVGAKSYSVDGAAQSFTVAPVIYNGKTYVELTKTVNALGGELDAASTSILSFARPEGSYDTLVWTADGALLANKSDAETTQIYKFTTLPGNYDLFSSNSSAVDVAVSPDQQWGAFSDENGQLKLINLSNGVVSSLGTDTSVKVDYTWSADGKTLYFLMGDKQEKIGKISVETGALTTLLDDKVENKSEVRVSADGKKLVYIVNVTGTAKNDADSTEDSLTVDYSNAAEQIYSLDLATKDAKPVALTTALDNKLYPEILSNGAVVYLSADADGTAPNTLKSISADKTINNIATDVEVFWSTAAGDGLVVAGTATDGSTAVYSISASGAKTELFHSSDDVSEVAVSKDGSKLAIISDGKVEVVQGGKVLALTK